MPICVRFLSTKSRFISRTILKSTFCRYTSMEKIVPLFGAGACLSVRLDSTAELTTADHSEHKVPYIGTTAGVVGMERHLELGAGDDVK